MTYYSYPYGSTPRRARKKSNTGKIFGLLLLLGIIVCGGYFAYTKLKPLIPNIEIPVLSPTVTVYPAENVLPAWRTTIEATVTGNNNHEVTTEANSADITIVTSIDEKQTLETEGKACEILYQIDYFPVMRFATLQDNITLSKLQAVSAGTDTSYTFITIPEFSEGVKQALNISTYAAGSTVSTKEQLITALEGSKTAISMVPVSWLEPRMKLLEVDNVFPLDQEGMFRTSAFMCMDSGKIDDSVAVALRTVAKDDSLSQTSVATVIQTGVTAMGRNLVIKAKATKDYDWFAHDIGAFLSNADLTHTSNEVSFAEDCTQVKGTMRFCAIPETMATLTASGIDLVELTGNHNNDWSRTDDTDTINMYKAANIAYFGGGLNLEDARKPYITEIKGTTIGFLGYNYYDPIVAKNSVPVANSTGPGANPYDEDQVKADIEALRPQVDILVVDFQFQECWCYSEGNTTCYRGDAVPNQESVFQQAVEWGADIVVGTQAHQPQGFEMRADGAIFYGLGNLYFDQTVYTGTKEEEIIKHYFYNGQHLTTRVYTAFYDKDYQPYLTTGTTRENFLKKLFKASGF